MADLLEHDPNIIERESVLSDEIKQSFEEQGGILDATADILKNILGVLKGDAAKSDADDDKRVSPIVDGLARLGVGIEETLDGVVGLIVDPIRKGLKSVAADITGGIDYAMGFGMLVAGIQLLWENWDAIVKDLGKLSSDVWKKFKKDGIPLLIDGFITLGTKIWDNIPESLKGAFEAIRNLSADVLSWTTTGAGWLMRGVEWALRAVGLDDAAVYFGSIADSLSSVADWFDPNSKFTRSQAAEARRFKALKPEDKEKMRAKMIEESLSATLRATNLDIRKEIIYELADSEILGGAAELHKYAIEKGLDEIRALHLVAPYLDDFRTGAAVSKRFREATEGPDQTRESVLQAYGESRSMTFEGAKTWLQEQETTAPATPVTPDMMNDLQGVVDENTAKVRRDEEGNQLIRQLLDEARKSNEKKPDGSAAVAVPMIDSRSADAISAFVTGNFAGGMAI